MAQMQAHQMAAYAAELEAALPSGAGSALASEASGGGLFAKVLTLISALRSGDWEAVRVTVLDIVTILLTDNTGAVRAQMQTAGIDWAKWLDVLMKILPILLG